MVSSIFSYLDQLYFLFGNFVTILKFGFKNRKTVDVVHDGRVACVKVHGVFIWGHFCLSPNQTKRIKCSKLFLLLNENVVGHVWIWIQLCHLWHCQLKKKYFFAGNELGITQLSRRRAEKQPRKKSPHRCITAIRVANFFRSINTKNLKG